MQLAPVRVSWLRRCAWFVLIWAMSVVALGCAAMIFRLMMTAAGLTVK